MIPRPLGREWVHNLGVGLLYKTYSKIIQCGQDVSRTCSYKSFFAGSRLVTFSH